MSTRLLYKHKQDQFTFTYLGVSAFISGTNEQGWSLRTVPCVVLEIKDMQETFNLDFNIVIIFNTVI